MCPTLSSLCYGATKQVDEALASIFFIRFGHQLERSSIVLTELIGTELFGVV